MPKRSPLRRIIWTLLYALLGISPLVATGCDAGGSSGNENVAGTDTVEVTAAMGGDLMVESTPSGHSVNWVVTEYDGNKKGGIGFPGVTPVDIPEVDSVKIGDDVNPPGFDRFEVIVQSTEPGVKLESVTLLNDGNKVATADNPVSPDSITTARKYFIRVFSP